MKTFVALILLFLLKIRYPGGQPVTDIVYTKYGRETLKIYRQVERQHYKAQKISLDITFLSTCLAYDRYPKFLQFKVYSNEFRNTTKYKKWQLELLNRELKLQRNRLKTAKHDYEKCKDSLKNSVSLLDFWFFMGKVTNHTRNACNKIKITHSGKLDNLGIKPLVWNIDCVYN